MSGRGSFAVGIMWLVTGTDDMFRLNWRCIMSSGWTLGDSLTNNNYHPISQISLSTGLTSYYLPSPHSLPAVNYPPYRLQCILRLVQMALF
ncbi:hypothetical protein HI914_07076 [Erysiphe necator]|nr:hypothetical protein HI914_07076 [Erysiphe necator]